MKSINNYIQEALIKKGTKISHYWSIKDAERGDIITIDNGSIKIIFIFKEVDKEDDDKIRSIAAITVHTAISRIYLYYNPRNPNDYFFTKHDSKFYLSTEEEKQLLFDELKKKGYKWNENKKEIEEI